MKKKRIVKPVTRSTGVQLNTHFNKFKDAETYQVQVSFIEKMSGLSFEKANELYQKSSPEQIILSRVNVRANAQSVSLEEVVANMNLIL